MAPRLSRRAVLQAATAAAVAPWAVLDPRKAEGFRFAFFSDTHVGLRANIDLNRAMLAEVAAWSPAFAINGGDVTDYGWRGEYRNYRALIEGLTFQVRHIAGNHDVRWSPLGPKAYREGTGDPMYGSFDHQGCHVVLLDSTVPLSHWGHFESAQLRWLEADLERVGREAPVFIATHHWVGREAAMVDNEAALLRAIEPYNVKLILNGHGHSDLWWTWEGIPNTMNKGLYQGSAELIEVSAGEIRVSRLAAGSTRELAVLPIRPERSKRRLWAVPAEVTPGVLLIGPKEATEARWGDGAWAPVRDGRIATEGLMPGRARLALRTGPQAFHEAGEARVAGSTGRLRPAWEARLPGGVMSHLRLADGVLFVSTMDGSLSALDAASGKSIWVAETDGYCHSSPTVAGDVVVVGSADGSVYAFDRATGRRRWRTATGGPVYGSAAVAHGVAAIGSGDGSVYGLDVASGRRRWRYDLPATETSFVQSPAATDGSRFYLGAWDKHVYALEADGSLAWRVDGVGERSFAYSPAIGGPCVADGVVFVPANGNVLWALDAQNGAVRWKATAVGDKYGYSSPAVADGKIVVGCLGDLGEVRCVEAATGRELWTTRTGSTIYDSSPAVAEGIAFIGSVSGVLSAISMEDGGLVGQVRMPAGHFLSSPVAAGGRVWAATYADVCAAFDVV